MIIHKTGFPVLLLGILAISISEGRSVAKYSYPHWLVWVCYPIGWLVAKFGMGEELVGIGRL